MKENARAFPESETQMTKVLPPHLGELVLAVSTVRLRVAGYMWGTALIILAIVAVVPFTRWYMRFTIPETPDRELEIMDGAWERLRRAQWIAAWRTDWKFWKRVRKVLVLVALSIAVLGFLVLFV